MSSAEFKRIQAYYPLWSANDIRNVIRYVNTKNNANPVFPAGLDDDGEQQMVDRFHDGWVTMGNRLFYNPSPRIRLEVIPPRGRRAAIQAMYNDPTVGQLIGLTKFFKQVTRRYIGIKKRMSDNFLQQQGNHQMARDFRPGHSKMTISTKPNAIWAMDNVYMSHFDNVPGVNQFPGAGVGHKALYIFVVVDLFSKKVWARPLARNQLNAQRTLAAFQSIVHEAQGTIPKVLISDGGLELTGGPWAAFCANNNINHRVTNAASPTENALVEKMNGILRRKLNELMITGNSNEWRANLQTVVANTNNQVQSTTGETPNDLWAPGYQPGPQALPQAAAPDDVNDTAMDVRARVIRRNRDQWQRFNEKDRQRRYVVGDRVRVSMKLLSTAIRQYLKVNIGSTKNIPIKYTPQILTVSRVKPAVGFTKERYNLTNAQGQVVERNDIAWDFYQSQLVHVPPGSVPSGLAPQTFNRAMQLNNI